MRRIRVALGAGVFFTLLVTVPRWTAAQSEAWRRADFEAAIRRAVPAGLPVCPLPGPERDRFLAARAAAVTGADVLWLPVCRVAPLPEHRIFMITTTRTELQDCAAATAVRPANVTCALEEPLDFLADARAARTWARRDSGTAIWLTSRPLAWHGFLIAEHRGRLGLGFLLIALVCGGWLAVRRARLAWLARTACHGAGEPEVPVGAELLLHWVLGRRCRSLPGDLSEEYASQIEGGSSIREANRWYRWQVFHSIAPMAARRVESVWSDGLRPDELTRRS
jgi:hypothetical protein